MKPNPFQILCRPFPDGAYVDPGDFSPHCDSCLKHTAVVFNTEIPGAT